MNCETDDCNREKMSCVGCYYHKEEDITEEIKKIVKYCRARSCEDCKYLGQYGLCRIHNPSGWDI